jgi:glycosyltransferase involved in cell wall biosynthesis
MTLYKTAILGTAGIPASYGGFETLAENLARYHQDQRVAGGLVVYCSTKHCKVRLESYLGAKLRYVSVNANGPYSVLYDALSLLSAVRRGCDSILLLGVSGAFALPLVRLFSRARIVTNVDGIEWKRAKWTGFGRWWLRQSEHWAVRFSHEVVADNGGIAAHIAQTYGRDCRVLAYGGDHAVRAEPKAFEGPPLPAGYALALCRIEPENNVATILEAFSRTPSIPLVFIGNWSNSAFGQELRERYANFEHIRMLDPIYDTGVLWTIRSNARIYIHGHSAGGTNPSLVEMMHFRLPVIAYDCVFNRSTTEENALFFMSSEELAQRLLALDTTTEESIGAEMVKLARERYTWDVIGREYFQLLDRAA